MTGSERPKDTVRVVHVINSLSPGGAERLLLRLLSELRGSEIQSSVVALTGSGGLRKDFEALGVGVTEIGLKKSPSGLLRLRRLYQLLRAEQPQVVQTWLYHADLLGGLLAYMARVPTIYWNVRHSNPIHPATRTSTRLVVRINAWLSHWLPTKIVFCASAAARIHAKIGYNNDRAITIENGFDTVRFKPGSKIGRRLRKQLGVLEATPLIGLVARYHPHKGHSTFIEAARIHGLTNKETQFVLCGAGIDETNGALTEEVTDAGLEKRFHLLGEVRHVETVLAALTLACSASLDEGFSNALGEAMANGVPCVATDVGASAEILGGTGWIVPPGDASALAAAWSAALQEPSGSLANRASASRERIKQHYTIGRMSERYANLYRSNGSTRSDRSWRHR